MTEGVMDVTVLAPPEASNFDRVFEAVDIVNTVQSYFRLKLEIVKDRDLLALKGRRRSPYVLQEKLRRRYPDDLVVACIDEDFEDEFSILEAPGCTLISIEDWNTDEEDVPTMRVYLVYQLTSALVSFAASLTVAEN
ncbi:MAG: hypothetical protein ABW061_25455, partial [Polyangiaceae bacterium]